MAWLGNWKYRRKITIDSSKIDTSDLSHFPVLVYLSSSSGSGSDDVTDIFTELGANSKKIAFTKSDGTTQLYGEIEKWDNGNNKAWIWVSRDGWTLANASDTEFYIYFDSSQPDNTTYIGDVGARTEVWDSHFKGVWHFNGSYDGTANEVKDSTSNNNDGEGYGLTQQDGLIGKCQYSDGSNNYIDVGNDNSLHPSNFTVQILVKTTDTGNNNVLSKYAAAPCEYEMGIGSPNYGFVRADGTGDKYAVSAANSLTDGSWHQMVGTFHTDNKLRFYSDGVLRDTGDTLTRSLTRSDNLNFFRRAYSGAEGYFTGYLEEARVSDIARAANWVKADWESCNDVLIKDYATKEAYSAPSADNSIFFGCNF